MFKKEKEEMASNTHLNDSIGVARSGDSSNSPLLLWKKSFKIAGATVRKGGTVACCINKIVAF